MLRFLNSRTAFVFAVCLTSAVTVSATDGVWLRGQSGDWSPGTNYGGFGKAGNWKDGVHAAGGGVATFNGNADATVNQNVNSLQLSGLAFKSRTTTLTGKGLSLIGGTPWIRVADSASFNLGVAISGTGALSVVGTGADCGTLGLGESGSLTGFSSASFDSMNVSFGTATAPLPNQMSLSSTYLTFAPSGAAGTTAATSVAAGGLTLKSGRNYVKVAPGKTDAATLTLGSISRETGAVLDIRAEGGTLGDKAIVKTTPAPAASNGVVDPWMVSCPTMDFLTYDAGTGFAPATAAYSSVPAADKIWNAASEAVVSADTTVLGFRQAYPATSLSFANAAKLTVGDGIHPAALLIAPRDGSYEIKAGGTIDFGGSEGLIWFRNDYYNGRNITISSPITGSKGLTIASGEQVNRPPVVTMGKNCAKWTGDLHIVGVRYYIPVSESIHSGAIYVDGGSQKNAAQLALGCDNLANPIYIRGNGICNFDNSGTIIVYGTVVRPLKSRVTLLGNATLIGGLACNGVICGTGNLKIWSSTSEAREIQFNAANTYDGETDLVNHTLRVGANGTFGTGKVTVGAAASVIFDGGTKTLSNDIESAGPLTLNGAQLTLTGKVVAKAGLAMNALSALTVKDLTATTLSNGSITAADADSMLTLDVAEDMVLSTFLNGGAGKLTIVKKGAGKLTIPVGLVTGAVVLKIVEGAVEGLKALDAPLSNGRLFWLDATQSATMTLSDGQVTEWRDAGGNGFSFSKYIDAKRTYEYPTLAANGINGKASVDFSITGASKGNRLVGSGECTPRTVFVVSLARRGMVSCSAVFGQAFSDRNGIRTNNDNWFVAFNYAHFFDRDGFFVNGAMKNYEVPLDYDKTQVLTGLKTSPGLSSRADTFVPAIGGYCFDNGGTGLDRNFNGQIGEVIAYDRVLSSVERRLVENYLAKKWKNAEFHIITEPMLPQGTSVTVSSGTTLDLGAADLSLADLDGAGMVESSSGAGQLTVSGATDANLSLGDGVTLGVVGNATLAAYNKTAPKGGVLWWLDASVADSITTNAQGGVTKWTSRVGSLNYVADGSLPVPSYDANDFLPDGKPGVVFNNGSAQRVRLVASGEAMVRTLVLVARPKNVYFSCAGIWGRQNWDSGVRYYWSSKIADLQLTEPGASQFTIDDDLRIDGAKVSTGNMGETDTSKQLFNPSKTHVMVFRVDATRTPVSSTYCLGSYHGNLARSFDGWICETIAYDRVLSDEEVRQVENYLTTKWQGVGPIPTPEDKIGGAVRVEKGAELTLAAGTQATLAASAGTVNGNVTVANPYVVTVDPENRLVDCVTVNGTATIVPDAVVQIVNATRLPKVWTTFISASTLEGAFSSISTDDPIPAHTRRYHFRQGETTAQVTRDGGLFVIAR